MNLRWAAAREVVCLSQIFIQLFLVESTTQVFQNDVGDSRIVQRPFGGESSVQLLALSMDASSS